MIIIMFAVQAIVAMVIIYNHNMLKYRPEANPNSFLNIERKNLNIDFFCRGMSTRFYKEVDQNVKMMMI
jgi:hypothetical protein